MIKEYIRLLSFASAIHMNKDCPLVITLIFLKQLVNPLATLFQPFHLIQRNGISHTSFPLTVRQNVTVTDTILLISDNNVHFCPPCQQFTCQTKNDIIRIFILMQLTSLINTYCSRVGTSMPTHQIKTSPAKFVRSNLISGQFLAKKRFLTGTGLFILCKR